MSGLKIRIQFGRPVCGSGETTVSTNTKTSLEGSMVVVHTRVFVLHLGGSPRDGRAWVEIRICLRLTASPGKPICAGWLPAYCWHIDTQHVFRVGPDAADAQVI